MRNDNLFGVGAQFPSARDLYEAAKKIRDKGFKRWDVYSPFPIHGMDEAMGLGNSKVSLFALLGGLTGATVAFVMVYYTGGVEYPLVVQGKPYFAFEPSFPIYFELTILLTAFGTIISMFLLNLLPRLNHPTFNWEHFCEKGSDDGFFVIIEAADPQFSESETAAYLKELGGTNVQEIDKD